MYNQPTGDDGAADEVVLRANGVFTEIVINNQLVAREETQSINRITVRGSADDDLIRLNSTFVDEVHFPIEFMTAGGNDKIVIDVSDDQVGRNLRISPSFHCSECSNVGGLLTGLGFLYFDAEALELYLGDGDDVVDFATDKRKIIAHTGAGSDTVFTATADIFFDGGDGDDRVAFTNSNIWLDFASGDRERFVNTEEINISGNGTNRISLKTDDAAIVSSNANPLRIRGGEDDQVDIDVDASPVGSAELDGAFDVFETANATLWVSDQVVLRNNPPFATDDEFSVEEDKLLTKSINDGLLQNDETDGVVSVELIRPPTSAIDFQLEPDGAFRYRANPEFHGTDDFEYLIRYNGFASNRATVKLTVLSQPDPPHAADDRYAVKRGQEINIGDILGVTANDFDTDGDTFEVELVTAPSTARSFYLAPDGSFRYRHDGVSNTTDRFEYQLRDSSGVVGNVATVEIAVPPFGPIGYESVVDDMVPTSEVLAIDVDPQGISVVVYEDFVGQSDTRIALFARRVNPRGESIGDDIQVPTFMKSFDVAVRDDGSFIVAGAIDVAGSTVDELRILQFTLQEMLSANQFA